MCSERIKHLILWNIKAGLCARRGLNNSFYGTLRPRLSTCEGRIYRAIKAHIHFLNSRKAIGKACKISDLIFGRISGSIVIAYQRLSGYHCSLILQRTVESWLRKEREEDRQKRRERKAKGLSEFEDVVEGTRVIGNPAKQAVQAINNGWAAGRLNSTIAGEENFVFSSNRVLRQ